MEKPEVSIHQRPIMQTNIRIPEQWYEFFSERASQREKELGMQGKLGVAWIVREYALKGVELEVLNAAKERIPNEA